MKNKKLKLLILVLIFVLILTLFFLNKKSTFGIYRDTLNTKVYLSILNPSTANRIDFVSDDGGDFDSYYVSSNKQIGILPTPSKAGYNFIGWYADDEDGRKIDATTIIDHEMKLYAHYAKIVCKKAESGTLHTETCGLNGGCTNITGDVTYNVGDLITYGKISTNNSPITGDAYDCDIDNDDDFTENGTYTERFYFVRENTDSVDNAVLVYYTSFDENGLMDSSTQRKNYQYEDGKSYLPNSSMWSNPALQTFSGKVSRYISQSDLESACGPVVYSNTTYFNKCQFFLENSKFQSGSLGTNGIWIEKVSDTLYEIQSSTPSIEISENNSSNAVRPVIEIPYNAIEGYKERVPYRITLDYSDGTTSSVIMYEGQQLGSLISPTKEGFEFLGWYFDQEFENEISASDIVNSSITLYAKWEKVIEKMEYVFRIPGTCEFNATSSTSANAITSSTNDCISTINHTSEPIDYTDNTIDDYNYTANKFIDTHVALYSEANFDRDFEIGFTIDEWDTTNVQNQATIVNAKLDSSSKYYPGFAIRRYNGSTNGSIVITEKYGSNVENKTLYSFTGESLTIKIAREDGVLKYYNSDTDTWTDLHNYNECSTCNLRFNLTTWFGSYSNQSNLLGDGSTSTPGRYIKAKISNFYIKLEQDMPTHLVEFNGQGGTVTPANIIEVEHGNSIGSENLPNANLSGSYFDGWWTAPTGGTRITGNEIIVKDGIEYYAHYKDIYSITFDPGLGTLSGGALAPNQFSLDVIEGETIGISNMPTATLAGHVFDGWYDSNGIKYYGDEIISKDDTYHARYKEIYTITFNPGEGGMLINSNSAIDVADGDTIGISNMPVAKKHGFTFSGWFDDPVNGNQYDGDEPISASVTYYAHWTPSPVRTVMFKDDDMSIIDTATVYDGDSLGDSMIFNPTKENYVFNEWYIDGDNTRPFTSETIVSGGNISVVASWKEKISYATITNNPDPMVIKIRKTGQIIVTATDGGLVEDYTIESNSTDIATIENNSVYGVKAGNTTITITGTSSGETVTIPVTVSNIHRIVLEPENGEQATTINVVDGSSIESLMPSDPTKSNFIFDRWYYYDGNELTAIPLDVTNGVTDDGIYKARWAENSNIAAVGIKYFTTLQSAINEVPTSGQATEVRILQDVTNPSGRTTVDGGRNVVIIGGNHQISCGSSTSGNLLYNKNGTLTIKSGTFTCATNRLATVENNAGQHLYIEGGTIKNTLSTSNGRSAIYNDGIVHINGGNLSSVAPARAVVQNANSGASLIMSGGTVTQLSNSSEGAIKVIKGTTATITGGTIISNSDNSSAIYNVGTLVIGTQNGVYNVESPVIQGKKYGIESSVLYSLYDGIIKGKAENRAVNDFSMIDETNGIEEGSVRQTGTEDSYYTLYYTK